MMKTPITVIVELRARPGARADLVAWIDRVVAEQGPNQAGYLGSTRYEVLDDPDRLIELANWESADDREAHMQAAAASGVYAPLADFLAEPSRITIMRRLL